MRVFLIRHADAVAEARELPDPARYLSERGRSDAVAAGRELARAGGTIDRVYTSPLVRAVQTAELIAGQLTAPVAVAVLLALAPRHDEQLVADELARSELASVAVIGHEPGVSGLGALLCGLPDLPLLHTAEIVLIDGGQVAWRRAP